VPTLWLNTILDQIRTAEPGSITRRSAGYPLVVLALLVGAPASSKSVPHPAVETTITMLVEIASGTDRTAAANSKTARSHGLNVLRVVLRDALIGPLLLPHIDKITKLAVDGFEAEEFIIRNSSLMLFSAVVGRLFGNKRVRDEHDAANQLPANTLFSRYPGLYAVFASTLERGHTTTVAASTALALAPAAYPVLMVRCSPSP
jgi:hypothetical protein